MTSPSEPDALALIHEGWNHLKRQRPLAAWACWQRALRIEPENPAATQAIETLASASELPAAAKAVYRYQAPRNDDQRRRWDEQIGGRDLDNLDVAAQAFQALVDDDPDDSAAWYNLALTLAWLGRNAEAIDALEQVLQREASTDLDAASNAWTLAAVLRQGAGAESLADELSHSLLLEWPDDLGDPIAWIRSFAAVRLLPPPIDGTTGRPAFPDARLFEWLDREMPSPSADLSVDDLPRVRASGIATPGRLRLFGPLAGPLHELERDLKAALGDRFRLRDRQSSPQPLSLLDTDVWLVRLPDGLDLDSRRHLTRDAVEHYYETDWLLQPRASLVFEGDEQTSLNGTPLLAAFAVTKQNDRIAAAKLSGVIRLREQLAARPHVAELYGGYPFDRLRRRVGLEPIDPSTVDPDDVTCMSGDELDRLDPTTLNPSRLIEAYQSARVVASHDTVVRIARDAVERDPSILVRVDVPRLASTLIFEALAEEGPDAAVSWIDRAITLDRDLNAGRHVGRFEWIRGQVLQRGDDPEAAATLFEGLLERFPDDAALLLDAADALDALEQFEREIPLLRRVIERAGERGDWVRAGLARARLETLTDTVDP